MGALYSTHTGWLGAGCAPSAAPDGKARGRSCSLALAQLTNLPRAPALQFNAAQVLRRIARDTTPLAGRAAKLGYTHLYAPVGLPGPALPAGALPYAL